jgi:hypothetical protein
MEEKKRLGNDFGNQTIEVRNQLLIITIAGNSIGQNENPGCEIFLRLHSADSIESKSNEQTLSFFERNVMRARFSQSPADFPVLSSENYLKSHCNDHS